MRKTGGKKGFTLAEVLVVVGILGILAAFAMISIMGYLRSMTKIEYDNYAKELFIAAQNNLTLAESQGYLGRTEFGTPEPETVLGTDSEGVYYFVVDDAHDRAKFSNDYYVLNLLLPLASIDEFIRNAENSCYILRYHKDAGEMLDVLYWSDTGRYGHYYEENDYKTWIGKTDALNDLYKDDEEKLQKELKNYFRNEQSDNSVIGYYGGEEAKNLTRGDALEPPTMIVENADKLTVKIPNPYYGKEIPDGTNLALTITGESGGYAIIDLDLKGMNLPNNVEYINGEFIITLDDVTTNGMTFKELFCSDIGIDSHNMVPGDNILIQAKVYNNDHLTNVAKSPEQKTNSIYGAVSKDGDGNNVAQIGSFRHLANLSSGISGVNEAEFTHAKQYTDLDWNSFKSNTRESYQYIPVNRGSPIKYNDKDDTDVHAIRNLEITTGSAASETDPIPQAGLFAQLPDGIDENNRSAVSNLRLEDFRVTGQGLTGALAGSAVNTEITNVSVYTTKGGTSSVTSLGNGSVGGLVGATSGCTITGSSASVTVNGENGNVGGLVGTASGTAVTECYTGGQTNEGQYDPAHPNVSGKGNVGGLIGEVIDGSVQYSYSTCSVEGNTVGGLIGKSDGAVSVNRSYAIGEVQGTSDSSTTGSLIGSKSGTVTSCYVYDSMNESWDDETSTYKPMPVFGNSNTESGGTSGVTAVDTDAKAYNDFVGGTREHASPYDTPTLHNEFDYPTVGQLHKLDDSEYEVPDNEIHIGDWPLPETRVVNR